MGTGAETGMVEDCFIACDDEQVGKGKAKRGVRDGGEGGEKRG